MMRGRWRDFLRRSLSVSQATPANERDSKSVADEGRRRLWRYRIGFALVLILLVVLFGISPYSALILVVKPVSSRSDAVFVSNPDCGQCYRTVVDRWKSHETNRVLLWMDEHRRLVLLGAVVPIEERARQKLERDGVAPDAIKLLPGESRCEWDTARILVAWLKENRDKRVRVFCNLLDSRRWTMIFDRVVDDSSRSRVTVEGVTDPRYDETNWWRDRTGIKTYFFSLFRLSYAYWRGEDQMPDVDWSPDAFESTVLESRR